MADALELWAHRRGPLRRRRWRSIGHAGGVGRPGRPWCWWRALGVPGAVTAIGRDAGPRPGPCSPSVASPGWSSRPRRCSRRVPAHGVGRRTRPSRLTLSADVCAELAARLRHDPRPHGGRSPPRRRRLPGLVGRASSPRSRARSAWTTPGRRRLLPAVGTLALLEPAELRAVVAHERAHAHERHDLVMLPFASMVDMLRWMPYARCAPKAVAGLLEMAADDFAARSHRPEVLASALLEMASASAVRRAPSPPGRSAWPAGWSGCSPPTGRRPGPPCSPVPSPSVWWRCRWPPWSSTSDRRGGRCRG